MTAPIIKGSEYRMALTHTFTRTSPVVTFADPYKTCLKCGDWITGVLDRPEGPLILIPCEHESDYRDVCPSWGPVDGCRCVEHLGGRSHGTPSAHEGQVL